MTAGADVQGGPWLLVSDIDDTLTGDAAALDHLAHALDRADNVILAVNSSRPAVSVGKTLTEDFPDILVPTAVITALGTEISVDGAALPAWQARFSGWPHRRIFEILSELGFAPHDAVFQTDLKVSFAVQGATAQAQARHALQEAGIECDIIASGRDDFDVIPKGAGKAAATLFVAEQFGVAPECLVVAGDSGNDLSMFLAAPNRIVVSNARRELIDALDPGSFYHARRAHAAGVHEGLLHFGALRHPEMTKQSGG